MRVFEWEGKTDNGRGREGDGKGWRIGFWNVAGLRNKDRDFWKGLTDWDVIVLIETWTDDKEIGRESGDLCQRDTCGEHNGRRKGIGKEEQ